MYPIPFYLYWVFQMDSHNGFSFDPHSSTKQVVVFSPACRKDTPPLRTVFARSKDLSVVKILWIQNHLRQVDMILNVEIRMLKCKDILKKKYQLHLAALSQSYTSNEIKGVHENSAHELQLFVSSILARLEEKTMHSDYDKRSQRMTWQVSCHRHIQPWNLRAASRIHHADFGSQSRMFSLSQRLQIKHQPNSPSCQHVETTMSYKIKRMYIASF